MAIPAGPRGPFTPLHPIPYRQPSYNDAQRLISPPPGGPAKLQPGAQAAEEVDDGGWTVDRDQSAYIARQKRSRTRSYISSMMPYESTLESTGTDPQISSFGADIQGQSTDFAVRAEASNHEAQCAREVQAAGASPSQQSPAPRSEVRDQLAAILGGGHANPELLAKINALVQEHRLSSPAPIPAPPPPLPSAPPLFALPPPFIPSAPALSVVERDLSPVPVPSRSPLPIRPTWNGHRFAPALAARPGLGTNQLPLAGPNRWGIRTPATSPSKPGPDREGSTTPTPTPASQAHPFIPDPNPPAHVRPATIDLIQAVSAAAEASSDGGWTPDNSVQRWRRDIPPHTPPAHASPPSMPPSLTDSESGDGAKWGKQGLEVAGAESVETDLPTPGKRQSLKVERVVEPRVEERVEGGSSRRTEDRRTSGSTAGEDHRPARLPRALWERSEVAWKRAPHPAYSKLFTKRRVLIRFPQPIRRDDARMSIYTHFEKYGGIRMVWFHDARGPEVQDVVLVFDDQDSVERCLSNPTHTQCLIKSHDSPPALIDINTTVPPLTFTTKYVSVRITGPRFDDRSRSASPSRTRADSRTSLRSRRHPAEPAVEWHLLPVPRHIDIDSVPSYRRFSRVPEPWARVRPQNVGFDNVARRAWEETGRISKRIGTMDLSRRIPEADIIPSLCNYFVDIVEIIPPTEKGDGWLIGVGGDPDRDNLIEELGKIPGFESRRVVEANELDRRREARESLREHGEERGIDANTRQLRQQAVEASIELEHGRESVGFGIDQLPSPSQFQPTPPSPPPAKAPHLSPRPPSPSSIPSPERTPLPAHLPTPQPDTFDPRYPHLRRLLVPTHRGRTLREEPTEDGPKFYDDAAVFVGRLVKGLESQETLFERFGRYGQICQIEYSPHLASSTYATAWILYSSSAGADRALQFEQRAVSFGSKLKLEKRRVIPIDVQMDMKFVDDFGRAYSPSMASQYSPPQHPREDEQLFVQLPPLHTGPAFMSPPFQPQQPLQWFPFPPPQPPHLGQNSESDFGHASLPMENEARPAGSHQPGPVFHSGPCQGLIPMMYAMGVTYLPPGGLPGFLTPSAASATLLTPPARNFHHLPPLKEHQTSPTPPKLSHPPTVAEPAVEPPLPTPAPTPTVSSADPNSSSSRYRAPILVGTVMENGVLKAKYDDDDLKRFRREAGVPEPEPRVKVEAAGQARETETGASDVSLASLSLFSTINHSTRQSAYLPPHSDYRELHQRHIEIPIPFITPPSQQQDSSAVQKPGPQPGFRSLDPRFRSPIGGAMYPSSIDYGDQGQGMEWGQGRDGPGRVRDGGAQTVDGLEERGRSAQRGGAESGGGRQVESEGGWRAERGRRA